MYKIEPSMSHQIQSSPITHPSGILSKHMSVMLLYGARSEVTCLAGGVLL
jgi:hypothetical protein